MDVRSSWSSAPSGLLRGMLAPRVVCPALGVLLVSLLLTGWGWRQAVQTERAHAQEMAAIRSRNLRERMLERLTGCERTVRAAAAFLEASATGGPAVRDRAGWDRQVRRLLVDRGPGPRELATDVPLAGADGSPAFTHPALPEVRSRACDQGSTAMSGLATRAEGGPAALEQGVLLCVPVFAPGPVPASREARRRALRGVVAAWVPLDGLLTGLLDPALGGGQPNWEEPAGVAGANRVCLEAFGRSWSLRTPALDAFLPPAGPKLTRLILFSGLVRSLALFALIWVLLRVRRLAQSRRQALAQVEDANRRLRESHGELVEAKALLRNIVDNLPLAVGVEDPHDDFRMILWNKGAEAVFGISAAEALGRKDLAFFPADQAELRLALHRRAMVEGARGDLAGWTTETPDGGRSYRRVRRLPLSDPQGRPQYLLILAEDITAHKLEQEQLQLAAKVFASCSEAICITDAGNRILSVNPAFLAMTGFPLEELLGQDPRILASQRQDRAFYEGMWQALLTQGRWQGELWDRRKTGEVYPTWMTIDTVKDAAGAVVNYIGIASDISERISAEENLRFLAEHDPLTGLPNRVLLADRFLQARNRAEREQFRIGMLFLDLDRFKQVNDTHGHAAGDRLLQEIARRLVAGVRASDTVTRLGGDEFAIMLPDLDSEAETGAIADKLLEAVRQPYAVGGALLDMTFSVGAACFPEHGTTLAQLLHGADIAMYAAKELGRNRRCSYDPAMEEA